MSMPMRGITYSLEHRSQQKRLHVKQPAFGSNEMYPKDINNIIDSAKPASVLDYGCGKGLAGKNLAEHKQIKVSLYDPFVDIHNHKPSPADLVICWNVLNNVEEQFLPAIVDHLYELTRKDLIIKFPLRKDQTHHYLDYFNKFGTKSISREYRNITMFNHGVAVEKPTVILTCWFIK